MLSNKNLEGIKDIESALGGRIALKGSEEMTAITRQVIVHEGIPNLHLYEFTEYGAEVLRALKKAGIR